MTQREKAEKFDMLDCVEMTEVCPVCQNKITVKLTDFKTLSFRCGLVWTCLHCHSDIYIKKIELESRQ